MIERTVAGAYLDTNVFIDVLEGHESVALPLKEIARKRRGAIVTSELTLAEALGPSGRQARPEDLKRMYLDLIVWSRFIDLRPVTREVLYETVELRRFASLKLPDAIHLATAILANCRFFVSRDEHFKNIPTWMEKITPDRASLSRMVDALQ
jgi:predicted nucleic acid-binding protein